MKLVAALGLGLLGCAADVAPTARAQRIASSAQLIGGPKAVGRIGDYLLENDKIVDVLTNPTGMMASMVGGISDEVQIRIELEASAG